MLSSRPLTYCAALALLWVASGSAHAQAAAPLLVSAGEPLPTRFVLCQREVQGAAGERPALMRTCLARRLEGERLVERRCRGQVTGVSGVPARQAAQRACEREALAVASKDLPKRPPPPPRLLAPPVESDGGVETASRSAPVATQRVSMPVSGDQ